MNLTKTKVIIINGAPQAGKDTFIQLASDYCNMNEIANVLNISSVDPIKDVLRSFGWDGEKTEDTRDIMARIKQLWISAQNGPTMFLMNNIIQYHIAHTGEDNIIFCHVREPEEIKKLVDIISGMNVIGIDIMTMFVVRNNNTYDHSKCDSDDVDIISQYPYDKTVYNNGDLASYDELICMFINSLFD